MCKLAIKMIGKMFFFLVFYHVDWAYISRQKYIEILRPSPAIELHTKHFNLLLNKGTERLKDGSIIKISFKFHEES